jgi:hypothetical protein
MRENSEIPNRIISGLVNKAQKIKIQSIFKDDVEQILAVEA